MLQRSCNAPRRNTPLYTGPLSRLINIWLQCGCLGVFAFETKFSYGAGPYAFLLVILRITGKRQVGQLAPFDLVLLLVRSNAVQNSMNGGDNSLVGGLISAATLVALNFAVSLATYRSKKIEAIVEGRPQVLIHNGTLYEDVITKAHLTHHELAAALRKGGCGCVEEVHAAIL